MTLAANALQKAIYDRLSDALDPVEVYDHIPQGTAFPYVVIGADSSVAWDDKTADGQEFTCTVHAWDALKAGRKSVKQVMQDVYAALHRREEALSLPGLMECRCEYAETFQEAASESNADQYYHAVMRFRFMIQP